MEKKLVSTIIPTYNQASYLNECIDSVIAQTYSPVEIIVVDDGSTDNTQEVLSKYGGRVKYLKKNNGGPASARNAGIKECKGELVAFLDSDDTWFPNKLAVQVKCLEKDPGVEVVFSVPFVEARSDVDYVAVINKKLEKNSYFDALLRGNFIHTSTVVARKKSLLEAGLFDEDRRLISVEDFNLWLRLSKKNNFKFVEVLASKKREHERSLTHDFENMFLADLYNFSKIKQQYPEWGLDRNSNYKKGHSDYCYRFGDEYFYYGDYKKARKYLGESLKYSLWNKKAFIRFICTFLPHKMMNLIRGNCNAE